MLQRGIYWTLCHLRRVPDPRSSQLTSSEAPQKTDDRYMQKQPSPSARTFSIRRYRKLIVQATSRKHYSRVGTGEGEIDQSGTTKTSAYLGLWFSSFWTPLTPPTPRNNMFTNYVRWPISQSERNLDDNETSYLPRGVQSIDCVRQCVYIETYFI